jgi:hypothetical protein
VTKRDGGYLLSEHGQLVWKFIDLDDRPAEVAHAHALQRWECVSVDQSAYDPLFSTVFSDVDIPSSPHIDLVDLET